MPDTPANLVPGLSEPEARERDLRELLSPFPWIVGRFGAVLLPVSVVLYVLGFVIAASHFLRLGVPVSALGHTQFIGAALLYLFFTLPPALEGRFLARSSEKAIVGILGVVITTAFVALWFGQWGAAPVPIAMYWGFFCVASWASHARRLRRSSQSPATASHSPAPFIEMFQPLVYLLGTLVSFGALIYPQVPQWVGGGKPRAVSIRWISDDPTHDLLRVADDCVLYHEVLADKDYLYLFIEEAPQPKSGCSRALFKSVWGVSLLQGMIAVVPRSGAKRIVYELSP